MDCVGAKPSRGGAAGSPESIVHYNSINITNPALAMETKSARLTVLIDPVKKAAFEKLCAEQDLTPSQVVRQLIREYLEQHGVTYKTKSAVGVRSRAKTA
jgi:hypothetical protein